MVSRSTQRNTHDGIKVNTTQHNTHKGIKVKTTQQKDGIKVNTTHIMSHMSVFNATNVPQNTRPSQIETEE